MRNLAAWSLVAVGVLTAGGLACTTGGGSKELAALERAYKSGVLTKDEYDAKKAAVTSQAASLTALEKALAAGVLTNDEYVTKKAALLAAAPSPAAPPPPVPADTPAPPQPVALQNPVQNIAERVSPADAHSYRMKMVKIMDAQGFERPILSASMLIPTDWQSQGATTWNIKDACNGIQTSVRATSPDGRGYEVFPAYNWVWADDPRFMQQNFAQKAQMGTHACDVMPAMGASDYLRRNLAKFRPNAQVAGIEPSPKLMEILQQQARQGEQSAAQYRLQERIRPDVIRARLKYTLNGKPVEEWLTVATIVTGTLGLNRMYTYSCVARAFAEYAPQGRLESSEKLFDLIASTFRFAPEWQNRVAGNALALQRIEQKGIADRSAIVTKNAEDIRNIQRQGYENQQKSQDQISTQFSQYQRGVETYRNPETGETVDLSNQYGHAWVNNRGEYLLSDQASFDPSVVLKEEWKPLEHVKP